MICKDLDKPARILVIDDNESIHDDFRKVLQPTSPDALALRSKRSALFGEEETLPTVDRFEVDSAFQGQEGLQCVKQVCEHHDAYAVAFVDVRMPPGWDGIETARRIMEVDAELSIVICTAYSDYSWQEIINRLPRSDRFLILRKPFDAIEVRQLATALAKKWELARESEEKTREITATRDVTVFALAQLAESRDTETGEHLQRMRRYAQILAERLALHGPYQDEIDAAFIEDLYRSSPLHDIGKVAIPDAVLLKPGRLTQEEFDVMKTHTLHGAHTLKKAAAATAYGSFLRMAIDIARHHHERFDGSGYPDGLKGMQIPLAARIVALADVYDALTSARCYKAPMSHDEAVSLIFQDSGRHFDPAVVDAFRDCLGEFEAVRSLARTTAAAAETEVSPKACLTAT